MFDYVDMTGKVALVTGATSGIGRATARELAQLGATVILVGRNPQRIEAALSEIKAMAPEGRPQVAMADLTAQEQIHGLAAQIKGAYNRLDVLVNNVGAIFPTRRETEEGLEATFALNYLSHFLLTNLLLDLLKASAPARIVNVTSAMHRRGQMQFDDLQLRRDYDAAKAYAQSKLAGVLFTRELARRLEGTGVTVNAADPGRVATNIWHGARPPLRLAARLGQRLMRTPAEGADTVVYLATAPELTGLSGLYYRDREVQAPAPAAQDEVAARRLWSISEELTQPHITIG